jgi:superfamily II DNA/RNA helicase
MGEMSLWEPIDEPIKDIPFVIDNQQHRLGDIICNILARHDGKALDIATAYFNIGGWQSIRDGLERLGTFRLLLGDEPEQGMNIGIHEIGAKPIQGLIRDLSQASFDAHTQGTIEDLIAFLRRDNVQVRLYTHNFLHAKCYLFDASEGFERIAPQVAIVGSSNFTRGGLYINRELNLVHRADLSAEETGVQRVKGLLESGKRKRIKEMDETDRTLAANVPGLVAIHELSTWYEKQWHSARDFKEDLIALIDASKFGRKEYTPFQVYSKAIFEYFKYDLEPQENNESIRSAVELSEFQDDAVKKARKILGRYDGVMIADSVGLGKTWIGKKLLEDYAYHRRYKAVVICPAALQKMWSEELLRASIPVRIVTQEILGREEFDVSEIHDVDVVMVDESHNFRNRNAQRYENLERLLIANNRRGVSSGERKKLILLTATPINNNVFDLYNQINLFTGGDRAYFASAGIGDLQKYFITARRANQQQETGVALFNLLEEVVIRRTRPFIKQAYPNATIKGLRIHWPERRLKTVHYNLEATYEGIYGKIVRYIEGLTLAPYRLETYKKRGIERDQFEEGREEALVGIFKSRYLKRLESSIEAFRISVRRALEFLETFESYILDGRVLDSASFQRAMRFLAREEEEDDATPNSRSDELDSHLEASRFIETLPTLNAAQYDLKNLHKDLRKDVDVLRDVWHAINDITPQQDAKLARLKELLAGELKEHKVLIFTYYKDTARYLYKQLQHSGDDAAVGTINQTGQGNHQAKDDWWMEAGKPLIRRMDSGADARERARIVAHFAPLANNRPEIAESDSEIDILISTDVLSEGQNLQDCGVLVNYDLHWNPTRMIQRAGRIDRIGTSFETLWVHNMFPDDGLESLLGLVESLSQKIASIDRSGLLDTSILGEAVHPQNFNTLRRIEEEEGRVVEEQEQFAELVSSEYLMQNLKGLLDTGMRQQLEELPDGIHSGMLRQKAKGVFFYFTAQEKRKQEGKGYPIGMLQARKQNHYWRYIDLTEDPKGGRIEENRYLISTLIRCEPDMPRFVPPQYEVDIFALQEKVIDSILQASVRQVAIEEGPKLLDPVQQTIASILRSYVNAPGFNRKEMITAIQKVNVPQPRVHIKALRKAYEAFKANGQVKDLLAIAQGMGANVNEKPTQELRASNMLKRDDLKLICFEYVWQ